MLVFILLTILFFTCIGTGLMTGLFFSFSAFILQALGKVTSENRMEAMKSINRTILNPLFVVVFWRIAIMALIILIITFVNSEWNGRIYVMSGSIFYLIGVLAITISVNVPLNNWLERLSSTSSEVEKAWGDYRKH